MKHLSPQEVTHFQQEIKTFYAKNRRQMPWREPSSNGIYDPYRILVSEIMLQQTQVSRVIPKYVNFIKTYPDITCLAAAELSEVLKLWSGLGYNRRAKYLLLLAQTIVKEYEGVVPHDIAHLRALPGIGVNTAAAICVYSWNDPAVFIETNIRTVFLHYFFPEKDQVEDAQIIDLVRQTLPSEDVRSWYYALMDIGAHFKTEIGNQNVRSTTYKKQVPYKGSVRQIRGEVLKALAEGPLAIHDLRLRIKDERLENAIKDLAVEQLIHYAHKKYHLG